MTIYLFYMIGSKIDDDFDKFIGIMKDSISLVDGEKYSLYAFTNKKKYEKRFKEERDMNKFFEKSLEMNRDEYNEFLSRNIEYLLGKKDVKTKKCINNVIAPTTVEILCTNIEYDNIFINKEDVFIDILAPLVEILFYEGEGVVSIFDMLNNELKYCLNDVFMLDEIAPSCNPYEEYPPSSVIIDELELFIFLFSNTFIKEKRL